tara:strand:+ start:3105 stop:3674 length:570 start_codon:yes stop_codon:yes gene_type:complete
MKRLFLSSIFLFAININSEILRSSAINCKILDQVVFQMKEGQSNRYNGYKDGLDIGEYFSLNFELSLGDASSQAVYILTVNTDINIKDRYDDKDKFSTKFYDADFKQVWEDHLYYEGVTDAMFGDDYIFIAAPGAYISLQKYNKNDWHAAYSERGVNQIYTFVSRCDVPDTYQSFFTLLKEWHLGEGAD